MITKQVRENLSKISLDKLPLFSYFAYKIQNAVFGVLPVPLALLASRSSAGSRGGESRQAIVHDRFNQRSFGEDTGG
jgi:hypothetical protein